MNEEVSLCARCAARQRTCCQSRDIYVTLLDVRRIGESCGADGFWEFRVPDNPAYLEADDDPLWQSRVVRPDRSRRVLKQREDGDCVFLGPLGCGLPLEVRPLVCRLHPCQYIEREIHPVLAAECPWDLLPPGRAPYHAVSMSRADVERWHRQLYEEIRNEPDWTAGLQHAKLV